MENKQNKTKFEHSVCSLTKVLNFSTFIHFGLYSSCFKGMRNYTQVGEKPEINEDLSNLCFVHGSLEELLLGKKCVVRDPVFCYTNTGEIIKYNSEDPSNFIGPKGKDICLWEPRGVEKAVIHLSDGHVILKLGETVSGNSVIVMK